MSLYQRIQLGTTLLGSLISLSAAQLGTVHDADNLNPGYTLSELHTAAWIPQVVDMVMMPDGRLAVLTLLVEPENTSNIPHKTGNLFLVGNLGAANLEALEIKQIATDLLEPTGIALVSGKLYVTEKTQLTEFTLDAGGASATARKVASIAVDAIGLVNFQEWALGLLYKEGFFYTALGGGVRLGGKSWVDDTTKLREPKRAGLLKINATDGTSELIAGGLRAPNGITWGPDGSSIWVTDNQGSFVPACKLIQIVAGKNYGYPNGPNKFRDMPETPPNVWYPYSEIGRSTTHPLFLKNGIFAGQVLAGDLAQGGVTRTALEKVNGEWQGSAHSFSGGFSAGTQKMLELPNGSIIVGGLGRGDVMNWGWKGRKTGLQKMTPKAGTVIFEMLALHSRKGGMEIEFTKPVGTGADLAASYLVTSGEMKPGPAYGEGNMANKQTLVVTSVKLSDDKLRAYLSISGLTAKTVVAIKAIGVKSATGEDLYRPGAWYTLNSISPLDFTETAEIDPKHALLNPASLLSQVKVYRSSHALAVAVEFSGESVLTLRSPDGRILESQKAYGPHQLLFNRNVLASGLYLLDIATSGQIVHKRIVF